jgi:hypothetical protein
MSDNQNPPQPDPAPRRLDRLVGAWTMEGNLVGSDEHNIRGQTTFRWLPGGFFSNSAPGSTCAQDHPGGQTGLDPP